MTAMPPKLLRHWCILGLTLAVVAPWNAWACKCSSPPDVQSALKTSVVVFQGRVSSITDAMSLSTPGGRGIYGSNPYRRVRFTVLESYKGDLPAQLVIGTGRSGGDCGFEFSIGETYLVFATPARSGYEEGDYITDICTRTAHVKDATKDLALLGTQGGSSRSSILMMLGAALVAALAGAWIIYSLRRRPRSRG